MLTYGFYNSVNHDRLYDATQLSSIFDGILNDGVFESIGNKFAVSAYSGMTVHVGTGKAWFKNTWTINDTVIPLTVEAAESVLTRIDSVILEVNKDASVRANRIYILKGTPASSPVAPTLSNTDLVKQIALANITVSPGATSISAGDITNLVGLDACPFVTGILQVTSVSELYSQWEAGFNSWENEQKMSFDEWFATIRDILDSDTAGHLQNEIDAVTTKVNKAIEIVSFDASTGTLVTRTMQ